MTDIYFTYSGKQYRLIDPPKLRFSSLELPPFVQAHAICTTDKRNKKGLQKEYVVSWDVLDKYVRSSDSYPFLTDDAPNDPTMLVDLDNPCACIHCAMTRTPAYNSVDPASL